MPAPEPANESERIEALRSCGVLDTEPEPSFDEIAKLASHLCGAPMALVSLVDVERQWFKARVGLAAEETSRTVSFCAYSVASHEPLLVTDTLLDHRFVDNPLVTSEPSIRFYAGMPLTLEDGITVGTLCVLDRVPRELTNPQIEALGMLARQVTRELKLRRRLMRAQGGAQHIGAALPLPGVAAGSRHGAARPLARAAPRRPVAQAEDDTMVANRYRILRLLGSGGMGVVAAAEDMRTGQRVAVKFLLRHQIHDPALLERFVREAQALLRIQSEHVVRVIDVGNLANGAPFIVMEYLEGEDLAASLAEFGPLDPSEVVEAVRQACVAVTSAHARGILHRDLKPANLFAARLADGRTVIKVLDFGIAKLRAELREGDEPRHPGLTGTSTMVGSAYYMSPEQMHNVHDLDGRSDIWSLGVTLYELLAGVMPFEGDSVPEVCSQVLGSSPIPLQLRRGKLSSALLEVVARCLAKDRNERFASADELSAALAACPEAAD